MPDTASPIGMFDSGAGGLAVLIEVRRLLPGEDIVYYADGAHFPYGSRPREQVVARSEAITRELLARGAKVIVVACNSATSAAIAGLRERFDVPFVGMEPALKPAAERTLSGSVALLVTPQTAGGEKLAALIDRYGSEVSVRTVPAPDLAERVESGAIEDERTRELVRRYVTPLRTEAVDVLALGCTHYAFLRPIIEQELGDGVLVIEPSEAVARQVKRVLDARRMRSGRASGSGVLYLTSGDAASFARTRARLRGAGIAVPDGEGEDADA